MNVVADSVSRTIGPLIRVIDDAIAFDYHVTFMRAVRLDVELADPRAAIRRVWIEHHERTRILKEERQNIIENAASIVSMMTPSPIMVIYQGQSVHP